METKQSEYVPFGEEWQKEVMKNSKPMIISMFRSCSIRRKTLEAANAELLKALDDLLKATNGILKHCPTQDDADEYLNATMDASAAIKKATPCFSQPLKIKGN